MQDLGGKAVNKRDAREMAHRLVSCLIEEYFQGKEPDTYDPIFLTEVEGRRLSDTDQGRFEDALFELQEKLDAIGDRVHESHKARDGKRETPKVGGKPGALWKKNGARLKRWGWR